MLLIRETPYLPQLAAPNTGVDVIDVQGEVVE